MENRPLIAPSPLGCVLSTALEDTLHLCLHCSVSWLHLDIMDGQFVPASGLPREFLKDLRGAFAKWGTRPPRMDVHLMVQSPAELIPFFAAAAADRITIHWECGQNPLEILRIVKSFSIPFGLAINPSTPLNHCEEILKHIDLLLCMGVMPGFCGQKIISSVLKKICFAAKFRAANSLNFSIGIDGGICEEIIPTVVRAGADFLISGSAIFQSPNPARAFHTFATLAQTNGSFCNKNSFIVQ
jgi:ribulose-phosphate 3-epimerase